MIQQDTFIIRPIEEGDLDQLYRWNTEDMRGLYQECRLESKKELQAEYEEDGFFTEDFQMLMIEVMGECSGLLYLNFRREGLVSIGIVLDGSKRRSGLGTKALSVMTKYLFDNYPVVRVEADTDVENEAAQKVLERAGYVREGRMRKYRYHHGAYHDSYLYAAVRCENRKEEGIYEPAGISI